MATLETSADPLQAAADAVCEAVRSTVARRAIARVGISGGSALKVWARASEMLPMDAVRLTWVDERCVDVEDPQSNRGETHRTSGRAGHELSLWLNGERVEEALVRVRTAIQRDFDDALDVTLLGMGADGHIASLFPGRAWDGDRVIHVPDSPKPPPKRMSLTHAMLSTATRHVLYAVGDAKTDAVKRVLAGDEQLPASSLEGLVIVRD